MGVKVRQRNGAWWLFIDHHGQRKAKRIGPGPHGRKAAQLAAEKIQAKLALGDASLFREASSVPTFKEAAERWIATHVQLGQIRPSTESDYRRTLRLHAFPRFGAKPVTAVSRDDVRGAVVDLLGKGKSRSLARNLLAPIRQTFNQLIDDGLNIANPAARLGRYLKTKVDPRSGIDALLIEEERSLLETARGEFPRHYPL